MNTQNNLGASHKDCDKEKKLDTENYILFSFIYIKFHTHKKEKTRLQIFRKNDQWSPRVWGVSRMQKYMRGHLS